MDFTIKTGVETYKIRDEKKKVFAQFDLNPGDVGAARRFSEIVDEIKNYKFPDSENSADDVAQAEKYLAGRFSYVLGYDCEKDLFGRYSPLAVFPNGFFIQLLVPILGAQIGAAIKERSDVIEKQVEEAMKELE